MSVPAEERERLMRKYKGMTGISSTEQRMPGLEKQRVLDRVEGGGRALWSAPAELRGDRDIVLAAVAQDGNNLKYAAAELKRDREVVLAAVTRNGRALGSAAAELRGDREIVLTAVVQDRMALRCVPAELHRHPALQWISTTNVALHCAKLRLALATCALPTPLSRSEGALSALPRDLIELIGTCILPDVTICGVARKYGYWCDGGSPGRGGEDPGLQKRKRPREDDVVE
jgi:hypothetical protein